eukprot:3865417-Prymnesium_polylepis.1
MAAKRQSAETNRPLEKPIVKLARNPVVVKKLVLVCHPDKCPKEASESATELFRFLQGIRENGERAGRGWKRHQRRTCFWQMCAALRGRRVLGDHVVRL